MLYLSSTSTSLLLHHVQQTKNTTPNFYNNLNSKELEELLLVGNPIQNSINIVEIKNWSAFKKSFHFRRVSRHNTTYLNTNPLDKDYWRAYLEPNTVELLDINPSLYSNSEAIKGMFTTEALVYFKQKYSTYPLKFRMEQVKLMLGVMNGHIKLPITIDNLLDMQFNYSKNITPSQLIYALGTRQARSLIINSSTDSLWTLLIGSDKKPPLAYYIWHEKNYMKYHCLRYYQEAVIQSKLDVKIGAVIFNEWLIEITKQSSGSNLFLPTPNQLTKLINLFE